MHASRHQTALIGLSEPYATCIYVRYHSFHLCKSSYATYLGLNSLVSDIILIFQCGWLVGSKPPEFCYFLSDFHKVVTEMVVFHRYSSPGMQHIARNKLLPALISQGLLGNGKQKTLQWRSAIFRMSYTALIKY